MERNNIVPSHFFGKDKTTIFKETMNKQTSDKKQVRYSTFMDLHTLQYANQINQTTQYPLSPSPSSSISQKNTNQINSNISNNFSSDSSLPYQQPEDQGITLQIPTTRLKTKYPPISNDGNQSFSSSFSGQINQYPSRTQYPSFSSSSSLHTQYPPPTNISPYSIPPSSYPPSHSQYFPSSSSPSPPTTNPPYSIPPSSHHSPYPPSSSQYPPSSSPPYPPTINSPYSIPPSSRPPTHPQFTDPNSPYSPYPPSKNPSSSSHQYPPHIPPTPHHNTLENPYAPTKVPPNKNQNNPYYHPPTKNFPSNTNNPNYPY